MGREERPRKQAALLTSQVKRSREASSRLNSCSSNNKWRLQEKEEEGVGLTVRSSNDS
jgi:hypothetical protein